MRTAIPEMAARVKPGFEISPKATPIWTCMMAAPPALPNAPSTIPSSRYH